jgi:L-cysteine:1D-myo-inositol 2-amino-2-deoxy-alpha-D-glucopyranoside ligase
MRLHETERRAVVPFTPGRIVTMYVCGITPYDATHLGHAATFVTYDVLQRRLLDRGHEVRCVRNITDVDDDLLGAARRRGIHYLDLAFLETRRFDEDMAALGNLEVWSEPRATGAIPDIRGFVHALVEGGHAYVAGGAVFFDVATWPDFGRLGGLSRAAMLRLGAERGEDPADPRKRDPLDFPLWVPSAADEPSWESPWGPGRPAWHVECSALAVRELGPTIDLHGGGEDLVHPHHECEIAQSEAVTGRRFVRHWMHHAMVRHDGRKMSKSLGNLVFVSDLRARVHPMVVRLALLTHHYRTSWEWDEAVLGAATQRWDSWRAGGRGVAALGAVRAALDDDLDVVRAVGAIDAAAARGEGVSEAAALLGVVLDAA